MTERILIKGGIVLTQDDALGELNGADVLVEDDRIAEVGEVDEVHIVTNARFAEDFRAWARTVERAVPVVVHDDGTTSNDDRLGAVGDMSFAIEHGGLEGEDLLVVAGDNLIGYRLDELVSFWRGKGEGAATADGRQPRRCAPRGSERNQSRDRS